jgi:hypothetical protein
MRFQLAELLAKDLDSDARHGAMKFAEAAPGLGQSAAHHWFPPAVDHLHRNVNWASLTFDLAFRSISHGPFLASHRVL